MTKSPKRRRAKDIEKSSEELRKKRRENHYRDMRYRVFDLRIRGMSMRDIAEKIGMSVGFVCKWCGRLDEHIKVRKKADLLGKEAVYPAGNGIRTAISSMSRAPKKPRKRVTAEHVAAVASVRNEKYAKKMGAQKIKAYAGMDISHQSINMILRKLGLVRKYRKRKQRSFVPFRRSRPNELWQIDYKEFGKGAYMLSVKDDYSSMMLAADVRETWATEDVIEILKKAIRLFGRPEHILSDRGTQFTSSPYSGNHGFERWCSENKIKHIMGRVRHPQTQGKIERWHGTVLEEAELPPKGSSAPEYGKAVLEYMEFYNTRRPHHGIGLHVPIMVYTAGLILPDIFTEVGVHEVS